MVPIYLIVVGKEQVRLGHDRGIHALVQLRRGCSLSQVIEEVIDRTFSTASKSLGFSKVIWRCLLSVDLTSNILMPSGCNQVILLRSC